MKAPSELKAIRILEITWLVIAITSCIIAIYELLSTNLSSGYAFFVFTAVATIMFAFRRRQRKRIQNK
jgi:hypothetical protein